MSRRSETTKHPAIMARPTVSGGMVDADRIPNWEKLSDKDRTYLAAYVRCGDGVRALKMAQVSVRWLDLRKKKREFLVALEAVSADPLRFVEQFVESQLGWSLVRLGELLDSMNEDIRLRAIKHMHDLAGIRKDNDGGVPQGFVNVNVFGAPSANGRANVEVIDQEGKILSD